MGGGGWRHSFCAVEGRGGNVDVAVRKEGRVVAEEECQEQGADVGTVHVSVGQDDDLVVAEEAFFQTGRGGLPGFL